MLWHLIGVLVATLFWVLPAQLDAFVAQSTGCHHNGTWYADKSLVPTVEKCLNCQCSKKTLVCRLKVCPEMPMPPPRGCVVVQKKNTCCPYLSCARLDAFYKIPTTRRIIAYLDHYERESIDRVVNENVLQRRSDDSEVDLYVCVKNGTVYKSGSAMSSSNLCTYCYCIGGSEKCVKPKCMLPVEGCKPIFVDSTCCPVRYDCSTKPSGKSSQEVRYRKTSNKHFLRMSQRLQRNRGCTVGKQYYGEGQKMKSDVDKPCDICFCIRGTRRCAPKKCSPSLKNCIPVVPKGQCCPSSYDCGSQRDYRRAQSSRQFNLFSMLFGKDDDNESNSTELSAKYPHDRQPPVKNANVAMNSVVGATREKGIFDRIREGLEFIDSNNNQMLADNIDLMALQTTETTTKYETSTLAPLEPSTTTEVSFLDLLLGPSENLNNVANDVEESFPEEKTTTGYKGLSWVDLLLGPDEEDSQNTIGTTISDKLDAAETTTHFHADYGTTNIDRMGDDFDDFSGSGEITVGVMSDEELGSHLKINWEESTTTADPSSTLKGIVETTETTRITDETTQTLPTTLSASFEEVDSTTEAVVTERTTVKVQPTVKRKIKPKLPITTTLKPVTRVVTTPASIKTTTTIKKTNIKSTIKTTQNPGEKLHKLGALQLNETKPATPINKPEKNNDIFTKLLDGISDILSAEKLRNKTVVKAEKNTTSQQPHKPKTTHRPINLPTSKQPPSFKPLPNVKHHIRINSKIANLTANSEMMSTKHAPKQNSTFKPLPPLASVKLPPKTTQKPLTTTTLSPTKSTYTTKKPITTTTEKPVNFKTNPTILDAEPLDNNSEPTLPPSLPNLKIIPFLPTDAVKADRNKPLYDFYHSNSQTAKIDYDLYDEANLYPSITERFPTYADLEDGSKAEYIYKFKVEGPVATVTSSAGKLDGATGTSAYLKYDFMGNGGPQTKGFSPPTETEGGFMPKEPLDIDEANESAKLEEKYQATKHIIDITTGEPMKENTTKPIEITTPDPFKDVIKTELPPNLISLIEDKKNNLAAKQKLATIMQTTTPVAPLKKHNIHMTQNTDVLYSQLNNPLNKSTTVNKTRHDEILMEDKNSVESFLDLLFREKEDETSKFPTLSTSTTIPPFKSLPQNAIMNLPTEIMSTKPTSTTTTTTSMRPPTMKPTRRRTASTTTRVKSKPKSSIRNNIARNTTSTITTLPPKTTKPRVGTTRKYLITTTTTTTTTTPKPAPMTTTLASTISTTVHPFLMSPFDKLPFMDASFEVKPHSTTPIQSNTNNLLGLVYYKNSLNKFEGLEPAFESYHSTAAPTIDTSTSTTSPKHIEKSPSTSLSSSTANTPQHTSANNLIDSAGILKLAGCNIYGRMYRVGRIILELSSPCLECKCTEVGVKCGPLDC